jgi:hemophore-related protein
MGVLRALIAAGGLAATVSLVAPGTALAQPLGEGPLVETTCSYAQIEAALQVEAPEAATRLQQRPDAQAKVQELLALSIDQRKQRIQGFLDRNPDVRAMAEKRRATPEGQEMITKMQRVADTCHNY